MKKSHTQQGQRRFTLAQSDGNYKEGAVHHPWGVTEVHSKLAAAAGFYCPIWMASVPLLNTDAFLRHVYLSIETRLSPIERPKAFDGSDVKSGHQASSSGFELCKNNTAAGHWMTFKKKREAVEKNHSMDNVKCFSVNVMCCYLCAYNNARWEC